MEIYENNNMFINLKIDRSIEGFVLKNIFNVINKEYDNVKNMELYKKTIIGINSQLKYKNDYKNWTITFYEFIREYNPNNRYRINEPVYRNKCINTYVYNIFDLIPSNQLTDVNKIKRAVETFTNNICNLVNNNF